jgi:hypothetical protein
MTTPTSPVDGIESVAATEQAEPLAQPVVAPAEVGAPADLQTTTITSAAPMALEDRPDSFVYSLGQIEPRTPTLGLEKEIAQAIGRRIEDEASSRAAFLQTIAQEENRYLARNMCWIFNVEGIETYILVPRDPADYKLLLDTVREYPRRDDIDVVIGTRGGIAPPSMCNGIGIPIVYFEQIYSFDRETLVNSIPVPESVAAKDRKRFSDNAGGFLDHVMRMTDNAGSTDEHRALNYLAVRYPRIYAAVTEEENRSATLSGIEVRRSSLSGVRRMVDVIFSFTHRQTAVTSKSYVRVDVSELFVFLVTPLSPYYEVP